MSVMRDIANGMFDAVAENPDPLIDAYYAELQQFVGK